MFIIVLGIFVIGYMCIIGEHVIKIDKTPIALIMGVLCWITFIFGGKDILNMGFNLEWLSLKGTGEFASANSFIVNHEILAHIGSISEIIFFLLGAMTIVEIIDRHNGFRPITSRIKTKNKVKLLWIITMTTFFMAAVLGDLTTTIVIISVLRKLVSNQKERWQFAGMVILAANAGGTWSPIGAVTSVLLWAHGNVTPAIITNLFLPCLVFILIPLVILSKRMKGEVEPNIDIEQTPDIITTTATRTIILVVGLVCLLSVPIMKIYLNLPPFMGVFLGLGVLWVVAEILNRQLSDELKNQLSIMTILKKLEMSTILFFIGILLALAALESAGHLHILSQYISSHLSNVYVIDTVIGVLSAIVDNVALVAACQGMYPISNDLIVHASSNPEFMKLFVVDGTFWELLAYTASTGGTMLIIGSAAGVATMGLEKIPFGWYVKNISLLAILGYIGGIATYYLFNVVL